MWMKKRPKSYKSMEIYHLAQDLAIEIHRMSLSDLPKFEMYEEGGQIRRSSKSIVSNIVEGYGRKYYKNEFVKFLTYALSSCDETKAHLEMLCKTESLDKDYAYNQSITSNYYDFTLFKSCKKSGCDSRSKTIFHYRCFYFLKQV